VRRWTALGSATFLTLAGGDALADDCDNRFVPDRPGATNAHTTVGAGCLHLASGVDVTRGPGTTNLTFPSIARIGIATPFELRLAHNIVDLQLPDEGDSDVTAAPLGVEVKWMALQADGRIPGMGAMASLFAPTNSDFVDQVTPMLTWLFDWSFVERFGWSVNLIGSVPPFPVEDVPRAVRLDYATVLSSSIPVPGDWLSVYVDSAGGGLIRDGDWQQKVGAGAAFLALDNLQLDASFDVVVTGPDHPVRTGAGIAWRL